MEKIKLLFKELEYFLPYISDNNIGKIYQINKKCHVQSKIINKTPLCANFLLKSWINEIETTDKFIFFDSHYSKEIADYIKNINPKAKIILYFWNSIEEKKLNYLNDNTIDEFWTFDNQDAKKYSLNFNPQFYTANINLQKTSPTRNIDILFVGQNKNRKEMINYFINQIENKGLDSEIYITENNKKVFSYNSYLNKVSQTNAILDIVKPNQTGLTLRCMEALFFKKKLITNNPEVKKYNFYNQENIFIYGEDQIKDLEEFIYSPLVQLPTDIIMEYDYKNWVKRFNNKK